MTGCMGERESRSRLGWLREGLGREMRLIEIGRGVMGKEWGVSQRDPGLVDTLTGAKGGQDLSVCHRAGLALPASCGRWELSVPQQGGARQVHPAAVQTGDVHRPGVPGTWAYTPRAGEEGSAAWRQTRRDCPLRCMQSRHSPSRPPWDLHPDTKSLRMATASESLVQSQAQAGRGGISELGNSKHLSKTPFFEMMRIRRKLLKR